MGTTTVIRSDRAPRSPWILVARGKKLRDSESNMQLIILWLTISSVIAFYWTAWFPGWPDPFSPAVNKVVLNWLIVVTMFAIGWMLPRDEIRQVARRWPMVLLGTALQYGAMPLLAYLCGRAFGLTGDHLVGIVMVGSVPGAMASNVLTLLSRGNASYSVSLTTLATLLSPLAVPLALRLFLSTGGTMPEGFFVNISRNLLLIVVLPVVTGHLLGRCMPKWEAAARRIGSTIAQLAILWIIAAVVGQNRDKIVDVPGNLLLALLTLNLLGYVAGYGGGYAMRLPEPMRRALTLEVGMQNAGLGAVLAASFFATRPATAIAPAIYTFGCMLTGTILARIWYAMPLDASKSPET